jgi:hypothetical protein
MWNMGLDQLTLIALVLCFLLDRHSQARDRSLSEALIKADVARMMAEHSLKLASDANIRIGAIEKSTHSIHPVPVKTDTDGLLESVMRKVSGIPQEDFDADLDRHGFDADPTTTEEEIEALV